MSVSHMPPALGLDRATCQSSSSDNEISLIVDLPHIPDTCDRNGTASTVDNQEKNTDKKGGQA